MGSLKNRCTLRKQRLNEYKQPVYINPMVKPTLQASDDTLFPLMDKVKDFLAGDTQVMLVLGDSGAGKSTFNRYLEHELWREYKPGDYIPLLINLPALERPERKLAAEHLRKYDYGTWNAESGAIDFMLKGHTNNIEAMTSLPNGQWIASG
ncbi:hypothetical protein BGX30_001512 [Mortierella sp. GBA39]|nr:hypothetical protein BGX30_001512 [Mortierella sp. GBA39]